MSWETAITRVEPNHLVTRGFRQQEPVGDVPLGYLPAPVLWGCPSHLLGYSHIVFLLVCGRLPEERACARLIC